MWNTIRIYLFHVLASIVHIARCNHVEYEVARWIGPIFDIKNKVTDLRAVEFRVHNSSYTATDQAPVPAELCCSSRSTFIEGRQLEYFFFELVAHKSETTPLQGPERCKL